MSEQPGPPQEEEREMRDVEFVRRAMELYCAGFKARQLKEPPEKMLESGRKVRDKHHSWAHEAGEHVPATFEGKPIAAHDRERFVAGFTDADRIAVAKGQTYLESRDPRRPTREPRAKLAEQDEMFPGEIRERGWDRKKLDALRDG